SGGGVNEFANIGSTIFAASFDLGNGVYASTDNGDSWHESGLQGIMLNHIVSNGKTLLASSNENLYSETDNIYRSSDGGASWQTVKTLDNIRAISSIVSISEKDWLIAVIGNKGEFYKSSDDALSWSDFHPEGISFVNP